MPVEGPEAGVESVPSRSGDPRLPDTATASPDYARRFSGPTGEWFLEVQERMLLESLSGLPAGARILDVGGLHGQLAAPLTRAGHRVIVLGSAPVASETLAGCLEGGSCRLHVGALTSLPYADASFEAVVSFRLLAHVDEPRRLIGELCRVARRSVVVDYPSARSVNAASSLLYPLKEKLEENTRPFRTFRPDVIRGWFRDEGFIPADERGQYLFPMAVHRMLPSRSVSRALEKAAGAAGLRRRFGSPVILRADRR